MKRLNSSFAAFSVMLILFSCSNADKSHDANGAAGDTAMHTATPTQEAVTPEPVMDSAAQLKAWENYMAPGDMHKWLASTDGKWKGRMTVWSAPDAPPTAGDDVEAQYKMVLGGRYQESVYKGKMMGMDFEGHGVTAYDNARKKFISTWIDNTGTGVMYTEGTMDERSGTITLTGKMTDPGTGKETDVRQVFLNPDAKTQIMELYCSVKGKEFKSLEVKLTKK